MKVSVVYALPERQIACELELQEGSTVAMAIRVSGLAKKLPGIDFTAAPVGIYGRIVSGDSLLQPGDRVEIYRPLGMEPKAARRLRSKNR